MSTLLLAIVLVWLICGLINFITVTVRHGTQSGTEIFLGFLIGPLGVLLIIGGFIWYKVLRRR